MLWALDLHDLSWRPSQATNVVHIFFFFSPMASLKPPAQAFEFTKRKRWTETLFSEVSETLFLIVSASCKVLYCGAAVVELLGWKEDQLIDTDLSNIIEREFVAFLHDSQPKNKSRRWCWQLCLVFQRGPSFGQRLVHVCSIQVRATSISVPKYRIQFAIWDKGPFPLFSWRSAFAMFFPVRYAISDAWHSPVCAIGWAKFQYGLLATVWTLFLI